MCDRKYKCGSSKHINTAPAHPKGHGLESTGHDPQSLFFFSTQKNTMCVCVTELCVGLTVAGVTMCSQDGSTASTQAYNSNKSASMLGLSQVFFFIYIFYSVHFVIFTSDSHTEAVNATSLHLDLSF